jgi:F-type H+-transporting ATPase subunit gamma
MASLTTAEKLIDAMRRVAAARIRASSAAALAARPFAERLQTQLAGLIRFIQKERIDIAAVAADARHEAFAVLSGPVTIEVAAQKALMDCMYLALLDDSKPFDLFNVPSVDPTVSTPWTSRKSAFDERQSPAPPPRFAAASTTLLVVLTSDRGFCGSYNKDVLSRAIQRIHDIQHSHPSRRVELLLIGRFAVAFFARHYPHIPVRYSAEAGKPTNVTESSAKVCDAILTEFLGGEVERVEVIYTRFASLISNMTSVRTVLPVTPSGLEVPDDEVYQLTSRNGKLFVAPSTFDTSPAAAVAAGMDRKWHMYPPPDYLLSAEESILLLNSMLPMYVHSQLARMVRESIAAELSARMRAMQAATDNCRDMAKTLKSRYHRERQGKITGEVIMVAGFPRN